MIIENPTALEHSLFFCEEGGVFKKLNLLQKSVFFVCVFLGEQNQDVASSEYFVQCVNWMFFWYPSHWPQGCLSCVEVFGILDHNASVIELFEAFVARHCFWGFVVAGVPILESLK